MEIEAEPLVSSLSTSVFIGRVPAPSRQPFGQAQAAGAKSLRGLQALERLRDSNGNGAAAGKRRRSRMSFVAPGEAVRRNLVKVCWKDFFNTSTPSGH